MSDRSQYIKRDSQSVVAVQVDLETPGFTYAKWGGTQQCKRGDWLVNNEGDTYTVDQQTFARTYRQTGVGTYMKVAPVWAEKASTAGEIRTKEGVTHYEPGDYLVYNEPGSGDGYAVAKDVFERMYEPVP
jgi:hypothetical protein